MAGFPEQTGQFKWRKVVPGTTDPVDIGTQVVESTEVKADCKTEITSFTNFSPTMEMNGTKILIQTLMQDGTEVETEEYDLLVVPGMLHFDISYTT